MAKKTVTRKNTISKKTVAQKPPVEGARPLKAQTDKPVKETPPPQSEPAATEAATSSAKPDSGTTGTGRKEIAPNQAKTNQPAARPAAPPAIGEAPVPAAEQAPAPIAKKDTATPTATAPAVPDASEAEKKLSKTDLSASRAASPASVPQVTKPETELPASDTRSPAPAESPAPTAIPTPFPEVESVHVEEPVPDEEPEPHYEPSPHAYHGPDLFIVQVTPEMAPVAKVGGLADVVFGLSRELAIRGNHVEIILPKYDNMRWDHIYNMHPVYNDLWVPWYGGAIHCTVHFSFVHDRKCFFIEPHSNDNFFNRGSIYGFADDVLRYAFFSRAAMEFMFKAGKHPDIIHCHDWQTALAPVLLYEIYQHLGMTHPRACLTIHNFKHQGVTGMEVLRATGLHQPERFFDYNRLRDNHHQNALNLLKGGIVYSNFVTTVSPRYAFETKDGGQGFGLEPTLHTHHMKYGGVVNGIDYDVWNPEIDHHIPARYGVDRIDGKYDNKRALRHRLMLADNEKPIVAFIGRLDPQKGLELVRHAIFYTLERGAQFVLLGSSPDPAINGDFWGLKHMLNDSPDCHLEIGFDEDLSHLIYAGADMMLVPSQFEPCGLTQLISLRYGTIPVVRSVGGLADTVFDKDHSDRPLHERNGYTFDNYDQAGLESALGRAIACFYSHPDHFRELIKNAMNSDNSWNIPGKDYLNIYDFVRSK